jgi:ATP-dependent RNA/DNA helicase IGHMBP2
MESYESWSPYKMCIKKIEENYIKYSEMDRFLVDPRKNSLFRKLNSFKEILFEKSDVVLMTCVSSSNRCLKNYLSKRKTFFDLVIIDEASQAIEASTWIPILLGRRVIFSGDHFQIGPLIKHPENEYVLSYTMFEKLFDWNKNLDICRMLKVQYRMHKNIMEFSSMKWYGNHLIADESIETKTLKEKIYFNETLGFNDQTQNSIGNLIYNGITQQEFKKNLKSIDPLSLLDKPLILVDTSGYFTERNITKSKYNEGEVMIVNWFVKYLTNNKIKPIDTGVITPYNGQVQSIIKKIGDAIEVSSVDGFQGREKEVIIISFVRSNAKKEIGFLRDDKRINVSLTRAKKMLVLICDRSNMTDKFLKEMFDFYAKKSFLFDINKIDLH